MNPAFDTLKAVKDLRNAGADEKLADATVATISTAINEQVATKADLEVVQVDLKSDIKAVRVDLEADIKAVRVDLKSDIKAVRVELEADINAVRVDLKSDIKVVRADIKAMQEKLEHTATKTDLELLSKSMTIRLGLMLFAAFAAMVALFNATN